MIENLKTIASLVEKVKIENVAALARLGVVDKSINDLYHIIEYLALPAPKLMMVMKELRKLLRERRILKEQTNLFHHLLQSTVEKAHPPSESESRMAQRAEKYTAEAQAAYDKMFKASVAQLVRAE